MIADTGLSRVNAIKFPLLSINTYLVVVELHFGTTQNFNVFWLWVVRRTEAGLLATSAIREVSQIGSDEDQKAFPFGSMALT